MHVFWPEPTVRAGCLYYVLGKLKTLAGKIVFRIAFAGLILVQFVVVVLLLWGLSEIFSGDNYFEVGILAVLLLLSPFLIGANSYFLFQRFTRVQYVLAESERWLGERRKFDVQQIGRRNRIRRWVLWLPALSVLLFCLFLDETWPAVTHLFHPRNGRLGGYQVSIPLDWEVTFSEPDSEGNRERSYVRANHWKGMLKSASDEFSGRTPSLTSSSLGCDSSRSDDNHTYSPLPDRDRLIGTRKYSQTGVELTCNEFISRDPWSAKESRTVSCVTANRDFDCLLDGGDERDVSEFYDMMQRVKKSK